MPTTSDFLTATQWAGILTLVCAVFAVLGFVLKWGIRFRLVGVTGFMGVLTGGLFALGLVPFTREIVPGAVSYSVVYDNGAARATISVPAEINESELEATLRQAASNLFSPGRLSQGRDNLTIRARTIVHPEPGVSKPLYIGQIERSLSRREDDNMAISIDTDKLAQLPRPSGETAETE